jgi:hypothetical protein
MEILQVRSAAYSSCSEIFVNGCDHKPEKGGYAIEEKSVDIGLGVGELASGLAFGGVGLWKN